MPIKVMESNNRNVTVRNFTRAIVRIPGPNLVQGLSTAGLGKPDYQLALEQHKNYVKVLKICGLEVTVLEPDPDHPDAVFVEDTALVTRNGAIITRPGALSRRGETSRVQEALSSMIQNIEHIESPGTLEAGDVMMVGDHFYIGLSERTNQEGADQVIRILRRFGLDGSIIKVNDILHLKSGISYLEQKCILANEALINQEEFRDYKKIRVAEGEEYAANAIWINDKILFPSGYPQTKQAIENAGFEIIELDVSEFRRLDGGLSCLSLRF